MIHRALLCLPLAACVLDPAWGDEPTRRDPIDFNGMASRANAPITIQIWNYSTSTFDDLVSFTGTSNKYASSPDLFSWSRAGVIIPGSNWVPPGADCTTTGMANLRVLEHNTDGTVSELATFGRGGKECISEHLADGDHPVAAGYACKYPDPRIVLFAYAQCVPARTTDATPPTVTVRANDTARAWKRSNGEADLTLVGVSRTVPLTAMAMVRDRDGAVTRVELAGDTTVTCRRASDGSTVVLPIAVAATRTQTVTDGVRADIGLEATRVIDIPHLVTGTCPTGFAFQRLDATLTANGTNAAGTRVTSPVLRFTL